MFYSSAFRRVAKNKHQPNAPLGNLEFVPNLALEKRSPQLSSDVFVPLQAKNNNR